MSLAESRIVQTRKELNKGNIRSTHANWGYLLLGVGVLTAVEGPVNTYLRAGIHEKSLQDMTLNLGIAFLFPLKY